MNSTDSNFPKQRAAEVTTDATDATNTPSASNAPSAESVKSAEKPSARMAALTEIAKLTGIGWLVVFDIVVPTLVGVYLDRVLGTGYIFIIGLVLGIVIAPLSVWRVIKILYPKQKESSKTA